MTTLRIVAVNVPSRLALTDTDRICEITNLYNEDGEETDDEDEAVTAVARLDDHNWFAIDLADYEARPN